ncbi:MAG TPA: hypothetical protein VFF65_11420 [Phycisphaerales bacterium]|nr:hypothetical protein [Phycisphaerales bacterium]
MRPQLRPSIALAVLVASVAVIVGCELKEYKERAVARDKVDAGAWPLEAPDERAFNAVLAELTRRLKAGDARVVMPDKLVEDVGVTVRSFIDGDGARYHDFRKAQGLVLKRPFVQALTDEWAAQKIIHHPIEAGLSDREFVRRLWATAPQRNMAIVRVSMEGGDAGPRTTFVFGEERSGWPYDALQGSSAAYSINEHGLTEAAVRELEGTDRSAHITLRADFADGSVGHIRLNYFYIEASGVWVPVTCCAATPPSRYWPWILF